MTATPHPFSCAGKIALVTGGGKGLGRAIAIALAGAGADVAVCGRAVGPLHDLVRHLEQLGVRAAAVPCDLTSGTAVTALAAEVTERLGPVDILVNNAGWAPYPAKYTDMSVDTFRDLLQTNLGGALQLTRLLGATMCDRGGGSIVNLSSIGGVSVNYGDAAYNATKTALLQFTRSLAAEWGRYGVRVNAILPGFFPTDMNREHWIERPELLDKLVSRIPLGRAGDPDEIGRAAVFFASAASSFVTGAELVVDGGQIAQRELPY